MDYNYRCNVCSTGYNYAHYGACNVCRGSGTVWYTGEIDRRIQREKAEAASRSQTTSSARGPSHGSTNSRTNTGSSPAGSIVGIIIVLAVIGYFFSDKEEKKSDTTKPQQYIIPPIIKPDPPVYIPKQEAPTLIEEFSIPDVIDWDGQNFHLGPAPEDKRCAPEFACDCCGQVIFFIKGNRFVRYEVCMVDVFFDAGTYRRKGNKLICSVSKTISKIEEEFEEPVKTKIERSPFTFELLISWCNGSLILADAETNEYGPKTKEDLTYIYEEIEDDFDFFDEDQKVDSLKK